LIWFGVGLVDGCGGEGEGPGLVCGISRPAGDFAALNGLGGRQARGRGAANRAGVVRPSWGLIRPFMRQL
jgi:hypothetical protein